MLNPKDVPICKNIFPDRPNILQHVNPGIFVGQKVHSWSETKACTTHFGIDCTGLIVLARNPVEAIMSHISAQDQLDQVQEKFPVYFDQWRQLLVVGVCSNVQTSIVWYDELVSKKSQLSIPSVMEIASQFWSQVGPNRLGQLVSDFEEFRRICANATGRSWAGATSIGQPADYHFGNLNREDRLVICEITTDKLNQTIAEIIRFIGKPHQEIDRLKRGQFVKDKLAIWKSNVVQLVQAYSDPEH